MVRKRYTEEQIIAVLNEAEAGARTADLCRKHGMSDATFYNWKAKYAGLTVSELKRLCSPHIDQRNGVGRARLPHRDPEPDSSWTPNGNRAQAADSSYSQTTPSPSASFMYG